MTYVNNNNNNNNNNNSSGVTYVKFVNIRIR